MAYREFDNQGYSRRALLRGGGYLAAGAMLAGMPMGRALFAQEAARWQNVNALAQQYLSQRKVANLLVAFGWGKHADFETVGGGRLGFGSAGDVGPDTLYRIYSMSKPITGMATMMLIEDGLLDLDQPVHDVLPKFRNMQVLVDPAGPLDNTVPAKTPMTIRQLLTHTAGLGYLITNKGPLLRAYQQNGVTGGRISRMSIPGIPDVQPAPSLEVWADRLASLPLAYQPATVWSYSAGTDLLGRVIEVAAGQDFESFLKQRVFEPCGMDSTWMTVPKSEAARLTDNYGLVGGFPLPIDPASASIYYDEPKVPSGGGGLVSTPRDYDRFLRMLLGYGTIEGTRVMGELAVRVGTSNLLPKTVDTKGTWIAGQGHGAGGRSVGKTFGWGGAAGTLAAVDFGHGLRSSLWTQYMPTEALPMRDEFLEALEKDLAAMKAAKAA